VDGSRARGEVVTRNRRRNGKIKEGELQSKKNSGGRARIPPHALKSRKTTPEEECLKITENIARWSGQGTNKILYCDSRNEHVPNRFRNLRAVRAEVISHWHAGKATPSGTMLPTNTFSNFF
jgi:hypothetical protein